MSRWLRFLIHGTLSLIWRKKLENPNDSTYINLWTWPTDADLRIINNASIMTYLETARVDFIIRTGIYKEIVKDGLYIVLATAKIHFRRPIRRWQKVTIKTEIIYWDEQWVWVKQTLFTKKKSEYQSAVESIAKCTTKKGRDFLSMQHLFKNAGYEKPFLPIKKTPEIFD